MGISTSLIAASAADIRHTLTVTLQSTLNLPCILDRESTIREWMADPRGKAVFGPFYAQIEAQSRKMFGGDAERYGNDGAIGMDFMDMMNDMPLVSVLMFQQDALPMHRGRNGERAIDASPWHEKFIRPLHSRPVPFEENIGWWSVCITENVIGYNKQLHKDNSSLFRGRFRSLFSAPAFENWGTATISVKTS